MLLINKIFDVIVGTFLDRAAFELKRLRSRLLMADYFVSGLFPRLFILFLGQQFRCIKNGNIFAGLFMRHAVLYLAVDVQG
jgi:hypothetical protein